MADSDFFFVAGCSEQEGIHTFALQRGGELEETAFMPLDRVMYVIRNGNRLYASLRAPWPGHVNSGVAAFTIDDDGTLAILGAVQDSRGDVACHLCFDPDGRNLYAANYRGGTIARFPVLADGSLAPADDVIDHRREGVMAHPHYVCWQNGLIAVDLGRNEIVCYGDRPRIIPFPAGSSPRHLAFGGDRCFCLRQKDGIVSLVDLDAGRVLSSAGLPSWQDGHTLAAIRATYDGRTVYASARGRNTLLRLEVQDGALNLAEETSCGGDGPRDFALSRDGASIYCANEISGTLTRIALRSDGSLGEARTVWQIPGALCVCV